MWDVSNRAIATALQQQMCDANPGTALSAMRLIEDAREWVRDCSWADLDPDDVDTLGTIEIVRGVELHYDGGWAQFVLDASAP